MRPSTQLPPGLAPPRWRRWALLVIALAALLLAPVGPGRASFPGGSGQIVVAEAFTGVGLDTLDPDGRNSRRIWTATTPGPCGPCLFSTESNPSWSPDGTRIAFEERVEVEIQPVAQGIAIVNADGTGFHWLVQNAPSAHDSHPHWSPDGTSIVFERTNGTLAITLSHMIVSLPPASDISVKSHHLPPS